VTSAVPFPPVGEVKLKVPFTAFPVASMVAVIVKAP